MVSNSLSWVVGKITIGKQWGTDFARNAGASFQAWLETLHLPALLSTLNEVTQCMKPQLPQHCFQWVR
eukprot:486236-Amphidinium_carterae.1